jgi:hypothetical protein
MVALPGDPDGAVTVEVTVVVVVSSEPPHPTMPRQTSAVAANRFIDPML